MMIENTKVNAPEVAGKLFSIGQIVLATFLGAPIAGCLLLARNYQVLGKVGAAAQSLAWGIISTIILLVITFFLPENFPNKVLPIAYCFGMRQLVTYLQGDVISNHLKGDGRKGSWVVAVVVGLGCLAVVFGLIFILLTIFDA